MLALKQLLQQQGISQAALAREVGLASATIAQWLNFEIWPKKPTTLELKAKVVEFLKAKTIEFDGSIFTTVAIDVANLNPDAINRVSTQEGIDMLLRKQTLSQAARKHFGIMRSPFDNEIQSAEDVFMTPDGRYVRECLWSTAKNGGFLAIVGESGAGKSTLRKDLEDRINREQSPIVVISPYVLGMEDNDKKGKTLKAASIADAIIYALAPLQSPKQSMEAKGRQVHKLLQDSKRSGFNHVLIIEEAHGLAVPTLKHLKRFYELEDGFKKLLSIILIGQTELKQKLSEKSPEVREVVQRCEVVELMPLDSHLDGYLRLKFERVNKNLDEIFDTGALEGIRERLIFYKSQGRGTGETVSLMFPLLVNNLVSAAMNAAADMGFKKITADIVKGV